MFALICICHLCQLFRLANIVCFLLWNIDRSNVIFTCTRNGCIVLQVAIASGDEKYIEKIREAQKGIDLPNVVCVDAMGVQLKEDNLHLTTEAQVKLGQMLADAYFTHFAAQPSVASS